MEASSDNVDPHWDALPAQWRTSARSTPKLDEQIAKVLADIEVAGKDTTNPHFGKKYAGLGSVIQACKDACSKHGVARYQPAWSDGANSVVVTTRLAYKGEWVEADLRMPVDKRNAQGVGSAITYGRRYGLSAILGIPTGEDDDGNGATSAQPEHYDQAPSRSRKPARSSIKRDAVGPRCRGSSWLGELGRENEKLMRDICEVEGIDMGECWDELLTKAHVDLGPYVDADGKPPQTTADLGTEDGKNLKKQAQQWLGELSRA